MKVLNIASYAVERSHHVVVLGPNEHFGSAFELLHSFSDGGQDETIYAAAILVNSVQKFCI